MPFGDAALATALDRDEFGPDTVDVGFFHYGLLVSPEWLRDRFARAFLFT